MVFERRMSSGRSAKVIIELVAMSIQRTQGDQPATGYGKFLMANIQV